MKRTLLLVVTILALAYCCSSCALYARYSTARTLGKTKLLVDSCGKQVVLVPMCHIGKQERYDEIRAYLDSLKADGYVTFWEGSLPLPFHIDTVSDVCYPDFGEIGAAFVPTRTDSLRIDTLRRKMRHIVGKDPTTLYAVKFKKLATQSIEGLGLTTERDIWVDYTLYDLIGRYEQEYGPVPLSDYDFQIAIDDPKYDWKRGGVGAAHKWTFLTYFRDKLLLRRILESPHQKIAVVYGASHTRFMKIHLHYLHGFAKDKKYNAKKAYPAK